MWCGQIVLRRFFQGERQDDLDDTAALDLEEGMWFEAHQMVTALSEPEAQARVTMSPEWTEVWDDY
jgi:hypothetical protein